MCLSKFLLGYQNIIFDLDGTLIDSSVSILNTLRSVLDRNNIELDKELSKSLVGPPLDEVFSIILGENPSVPKSHLIDQFIELYDKSNWMSVQLFDGVLDILNELISKEKNIFIVTNKRSSPTQLITSYLNIAEFFKGIYSIDSFIGVTKKHQVITKCIDIHLLSRPECIYIGDTKDDINSAREAGIDSILINWNLKM